MAKTSESQPLPGNDGSWFLELVGAQAADPHHAETLAEMASPEPDGEDVPAAVGASAVVGNAPTTETSGTAALDTGSGDTATSGSNAPPPGAASATEDALRDWEPEEMSKPLRSRRPFRWATILALALLVAAIVTAVIVLPGAAEREADLLAADYREALIDLRNVLPATQTALANVADTTSTEEAVAAAVPTTAELSAASHDVAALAAEPLPQTLPLIPRGPLEELEPTREAMVLAAAAGDVIAVRIGHGFAYRTTVPALLTTPELPTEADSSTINQLSVTLAESLADTSQLVSQLPDDPAFTEVRAMADSATIRFAAWQPEYLDALRNGDLDRATALIVELDEIRAGLADANAAALLVLRTDLDEQIVVLADGIEATIFAIPT